MILTYGIESRGRLGRPLQGTYRLVGTLMWYAYMYISYGLGSPRWRDDGGEHLGSNTTRSGALKFQVVSFRVFCWPSQSDRLKSRGWCEPGAILGSWVRYSNELGGLTLRRLTATMYGSTLTAPK